MTSRRRLPAARPAPPAPERWFVGIDQSLTAFAAAAVRAPGDTEPSILLVRPRTRGARRLWDLRDCLVDWLGGLGDVAHVSMEGYAFSRQMGHALGECGGMTKLALLDAYGPDALLAYPTIPTPAQLKMFVGLAGNAKKNLMIKAVFQKYGMDFDDDNVADAFVLAQISASLELGARFEYQQKVLAKIGVHAEWEQPTPQRLRPSRTAKSSA